MTSRPAPGTGRTRLVDHVALRLGVLRGLAGWLERATRPDGALICPRHRVEHTGKNVYRALIDLELWRFTREGEHLEQARRVALRTLSMLGDDPESEVPVFLPGRVDPRNASTNAIDGGACADTLATLLEECPQIFSEEEAAAVRAGLERHVEGYLRHACRDRPITAQRLWAGTGVARAARLLGRDDWRADALAGCRLALAELSADGVAPYIPAGSSHCTHPGLADASGFYHSRTPGFVLYIHEILGEPFDDQGRERLSASLDALVALRDGNGRKVLHNEAKAWYWEGAYEVASHPFDAFALHAGARLLGRPELSAEAGAAMEEWIAHLSSLDGGATSHVGPGVDFQCRVFWTAHGAWAARVIADVPVRRQRTTLLDVELPASGLLHVERARYTAVLRGRRPASSNLFGCDAGGGTLQSLVVRAAGESPLGRELVAARRFRRRREGSLRVRPRGGPGHLRRWVALLRAQSGDLRFRLFVASVEWGAGRWIGALVYPLRHLVRRTWDDASPWHAAHCDLETTQHYDGREVVFRGGVADAEGRRLPGAETERRYRFEADGVVVHDELRLSGQRARVAYLLPAALTDVEVSSSGAALWRSGRRLALRATGGEVTLRVSGRYAC